MGYAFISYSSRQHKDAERLRLLLRENEIDTWMAPYDIPDSCEYTDVINDAIRNAACFVLLLTEDSQNSVYVDKEVERALHYGKTIAPIQLDTATLNDSFSFYLCNQQIVMVPTIDTSVPQMQSLLEHLQFLCNDRLPQKEAAADAARDKRVRRQRFSRLFIWAGIALMCLALLCGDRYVSYSARGTYQEMYGTKYVPMLPEIARTYILYFLMALGGILVYLYGHGLRDPQKKTWNPVEILPGNRILPAFSVLCFIGFAMLSYAQKSVAAIIWGLEAYYESTEAYILPQWVVPVTWIFGAAGICTALICVILAVVHDRKNGFAYAKSLGNKLRTGLTRGKRGGK